MRDISNIEGINIVLNINDCAHQCLYCFFDNHRNSKLTYNRFLAVIERFIDWKMTRGLTDFDIPFTLFHCDDYNLATLKKMVEMARRLGNHRSLFLGGLRMRSESEMRKWLQERRDLGIKFVFASFAGYGEVHDSWNGRTGDFDFLMNTSKIAGEMGMVFRQRLFLLKSTLPTLERLIDRLDQLPGKVKSREIYPLSYSGRAGQLEEERVTDTDLDCLPEQVTKFFFKRATWHTEGEWMDIISKEENSPVKVMLKLWLDDTNIERIEALSCEEIVAELENRTRAAFAALPTRQELSKECGNAANTYLYQYSHDIERKWLDRYLAKYPLQFERQLTYLSMFN